jgi:hypothetical protein
VLAFDQLEFRVTGFCCTGSNAPFWLKVGAIFVGAFGGYLDSLPEGWVDGGHDLPCLIYLGFRMDIEV